jgi:hypothetical protein
MIRIAITAAAYAICSTMPEDASEAGHPLVERDDARTFSQRLFLPHRR